MIELDDLFQPSKLDILLVDDIPQNIAVLSDTLEEIGYNILIATTGRAGVNVAMRSHPDLVLLDIMMPDMDGFEALRLLKEEESTRDIPVIFITAKTEQDYINEGFRLGCADYIIKPFFYEEVCLRIERSLKLQVYLRRLTRLNDLKNRFIGMAAHDLRGPIGNISTMIEMVLDKERGLSEEKKERFLQLTHASSCEMRKMVDDFLDISVIESGRLSVERVLVPLKALLQQRIDLLRLQANEKEIELQTDLLEVPEVLLDPQRICQVLDNLLSNALKFSTRGAVVQIGLKDQGTEAMLYVRDEGPGISEEDQANLFEMFQTLSAKPTGKESTTGVGLFIASNIIEAHGGRIVVQSELGVGSEFQVMFPYPPVAES